MPSLFVMFVYSDFTYNVTRRLSSDIFYLDTKAVFTYTGLKLQQISRLLYSKLVNFCRQNAKHWVIFHDILTTKASNFLLKKCFAIFTFYGAHEK